MYTQQNGLTKVDVIHGGETQDAGGQNLQYITGAVNNKRLQTNLEEIIAAVVQMVCTSVPQCSFILLCVSSLFIVLFC